DTSADAFRSQKTGGEFIHDDQVAVDVTTSEQGHGVMSETIVNRGEPFEAAMVIKVIENMDAVAEGVEELTGSDVPIAIAPGGFTPTGQGGEVLFITGVDEFIVAYTGGDEAGIGFGAVLVGKDEFVEIPKVSDAAGVGGGIDAGTPIRFGGAQAGLDVVD